MDKEEPTIKDVSRKIDDLAGLVTGFIETTGNSFNYVQKEISGMKEDISNIRGKISGMKGEITDIKDVLFEIKTVQNEHGRKLEQLAGEQLDHSIKLNRLTSVQDGHSKLLHQIKGDTEMLIEHDMKHEKKIGVLSKDNKIIKATIGI